MFSRDVEARFEKPLSLPSSEEVHGEAMQVVPSSYASKLKACVSSSRLLEEAEDGVIIDKSTMIHHEFPLVFNSSRPEPDMLAKLICEIDASGVWQTYLTEITGSKVRYLFGRSFAIGETIELDSLIPEDKKKNHRVYISSILSEGPRSSYWGLLFNGMMSRILKIQNYGDHTPRFVKIFMTLNTQDVESRTRYEFNIELKDETISSAVATKAGQITHDLRGYMKAGINTLHDDACFRHTREEYIQFMMRLSPEELGRMYDLQRERDEQLLMLFDQGLKLCMDSREDFLPESIMKDCQANSPAVLDDQELFVDDTLRVFIEQKVALSSLAKCGISYMGHTNIKLGSLKIDILGYFILNLVRNAIQAGAKQVDIKSSYEPDMLTLEVTDNGVGMPSSLMSNFFTRTMPTRRKDKKTERDIEANRGEGTLIANERWESIGGSSSVMSRQDKQPGTTFKLSIPVCRDQFFKQPTSLLTHEQAQRLEEIKISNPIILLVDDSLVQLKMLYKKVSKILYSADMDHNSQELQSLTPSDWQKKGFLIEDKDPFCIICAAEGAIAYHLVETLPVRVIITDYEMPVMNGLDLIVAIRALEKSKSLPRMSIALHTALISSELPKHLLPLIDMLITKGDRVSLGAFFSGMQECSEPNQFHSFAT